MPHLHQQSPLPGSRQSEQAAVRRYSPSDHPRIADICKNVCECAAQEGTNCSPYIVLHCSVLQTLQSVGATRWARYHPCQAGMCAHTCTCAHQLYAVMQCDSRSASLEACMSVHPLPAADGGSDVLPRTIQMHLAHNPAATVLVSQPAADQPVNGVGE
jgi:hypothetical protein